MDDRTHHHHHGHAHGGRTHVHASVDHLANELGNSARLAIRLDGALMEKLGVAADAIVRVATERGRSILARLDPPLEDDAGTGVVRLDRFVRQALKAHLNEQVEIEAADDRAGQAHRAHAGGRRLDGARSRAAPQEGSGRRAARRPASARCSTSRSRTRTPARPTRSTRSSDGPGVVDETTEVVAQLSRLPSARRRLRRHLRGRRRPEQADQAHPRAGAAAAHASARLSPSRHQSAARHHPLRPARLRQDRISRARSPTRSTRASITSTART